ncbi:MAG: LysE family transporter [Actinomycetia bacterium]|nr:LysE family transporter [Actinomycetes bacterium]
MLFVTGFLLGLASVVPLGPVSLLLVNVGMERGPRVGVRAGLGVALGDAAMLPIVLLSADRLTRIESTQTIVELGVALILGVLGLRALAGRTAVQAMARRITRPTLTMLTATLVSPMGMAGWLGLALLIPDGAGGLGSATYGGGIIAASLLWHLFLGIGSGTVGSFATDKVRHRLDQGSGMVMLGVAGALLV